MPLTDRLLIIGLDGATFDLMAPWARQRELPNLARLMDAGTYQPLRSTLPPMSFPAWNTFMTGKNVAKHGVFDFTERKPNSYGVQFTNGSSRQTQTIWSILSRAQKRICVMAVPCTYPPEPLNGVMISGFDAPSAGPGSMYPPGLYEEIRTHVGEYMVAAQIAKDIDRDRPDLALQSILQTIDRKAATALYLLEREPWHCFMAMFGESDLSAHHFWKYHDPHSPHYEDFPGGGDPLLTVYRRLDKAIGDLLGAVPPGTTTIVMSDHGHGGTGDKVIYVNRWLASHGLFTFRSSNHARGLAGARVRLARLGGRAKNLAIRVIPYKARKLLMYERRAGVANRVESWLRFGSIDWSRTKAFSEETPYYPMIWINVRGREPEGIVEAGAMYEAVRQEVKDRLLAWTDPESGHPLVRAVFGREEVYQGPYLEKVPDLLVAWHLDRGYSYLSRPSYQARSEQFIEGMPKDAATHSRFMMAKSGSHRDYGILIMAGKAIVPRAQLRDPQIADLAPTILALLGVAAPAGMDGRTLTEALERVPELMAGVPGGGGEAADYATEVEGAGHGHGVRYSEEEARQIETRLKDLGYID
ncbi:MAG: alkaline phosphatase family protein [Candidatus Rokubacteria bacterium]|nr:alkaline phosphatase family protein [Candidatus Rokubacteria bacterium]